MIMAQRTPLQPTLRTTDEIAQELNLHPRTLINWRSQGKGPAFVRVGRSIRYRDTDIAAWLEQRTQEGEM